MDHQCWKKLVEIRERKSATDIVHDPKIGVEDTSSFIAGFLLSSLVSFLGVAGLVIGLK